MADVREEESTKAPARHRWVPRFLSIWTSQQISLVGFVANLLAVPWVTLVVTPLALAGLAWRSASGARVTALGLLVLGGTGIAAALWHYFVAASSTSCNLTLADRIMNFSGLPALLPEVFEARASCADAAVSLLGVPYVLWALGLFIATAATALWLLLRRRRVNASAR